jgi:hypothetical protein
MLIAEIVSAAGRRLPAGAPALRLDVVILEEAPRAYTLEWRNWQTHGTQKPSQPGTQR